VSVEEDFEIARHLGISFPCYVRKIDRPSHAGQPDDAPERRANAIRENVLSEEGGVISVFRVNSGEEVARAALAINFARFGHDRLEDLTLIAFTEDDLEGVDKQQTSDTFVCGWAQRNHWNLMVSDEKVQMRVATRAVRRTNVKERFSKKKMNAASEAARANGCRSVLIASRGCICDQE
jgi:hypothetical protein